MDQVVIAITGMVSIWLTQQHRESWKRYACLIGMAGQPFFLYATFIAEQWGMLLLSSFYTYSWGLGIYNNWIRKEQEEEDTVGRSLNKTNACSGDQAGA